MPDKVGRYTARERTFIEAMARTGDKIYAAERAGYAQPSRDAGRNLAKPDLQAEIVRREMQRLYNEALPAAVNCLVSIITNDKAPAGARVQAAKVVMDRTLGADDATRGKEPHEMSGDELAKAISDLERIAADRARPINGVKVAAPSIFE